MTKLYNDMREAIEDHFSDHAITKAVTEVALKWIEKAYKANEPVENSQQDEFRIDFKTWLKENALSEDSGIVVSNGITSTE
jgi:hypothetical protein